MPIFVSFPLIVLKQKKIQRYLEKKTFFITETNATVSKTIPRYSEFGGKSEGAKLANDTSGMERYRTGNEPNKQQFSFQRYNTQP